MGLAQPDGDSSDEMPDGVSVTDRLRAWWNGEELDVKPGARTATGGKRGGDADGDDAAAYTADLSAGEAPWSETRRQLAQEIWSHGFVVPGGTEYIEKLVGGCTLGADDIMLEIGVGMGGGSRTIIGKFGNRIIGYARNADLAAAAVRHAVTYEIDGKLDVTAMPFEEIDLGSGYFDAALLRDVLYTMKDKNGFIAKVGASLTTGDSRLIVTDFLFDADDASDELAAWKSVEERPVYPWTEAAAVRAIEGAGASLRTVEDESEAYCAMVVRAWSDYLKTVDAADVTPEMGRELAREGEFWARRIAALKAGALRYYRIEAVKTA